MRLDVGRIPLLGWSDSAGRVVELAQYAESIGADRFYVADHRFHFDCFDIMTACALATKQISVECLVTDPFVRHPALTANAIATIAELSNGRVVLGMSGGQQRMFGGEVRRKPLRALREAVYVIRSMWKGETVNFEGEIIKCDGAKLDYPLAHKIPILLAGRAPKAVELAGEIADIVHLVSPFINKRQYTDNLELVKKGLSKSGRRFEDVEVDVSASVCVSEDGENAFLSSKRQAASGIKLTSGMDDYAKETYRDYERPKEFVASEKIVNAFADWDPWGSGPLPDQLAGLLDRETVQQFAICGTPREVAERLREISEYPHVGCIRTPLIPVLGKPTFEGLLETLTGLGKARKIMESSSQPRLKAS